MSTRTVAHRVTTCAALPDHGAQPRMRVSTIDVDRDGDRIYPQGVELDNFARNSPLLWAHEHAGLPIGVVTDIAIAPGNGIEASWRWLENDPFADRVKNAWEQGVVRAASIGFLPLQSHPNEHGGQDITRWDLLEVSLCPIPANQHATRMLKALGLLDSNNHSERRPRLSEQHLIDATAEALAGMMARSLAPVYAAQQSVPHIDDDDDPDELTISDEDQHVIGLSLAEINRAIETVVREEVKQVAMETAADTARHIALYQLGRFD